MSLSWEVCRTRTSSANVSVADNKVDTKENRTWSINFQAIASGIDDPFDVSEISAMRAPGVPILKRSVYVDPDGTVFVYFTCKNKTATRNPKNPYVFDISCEYEDPTGEQGQEPQPDPESYAPSVKYTVKSRQRSSWSDMSTPPVPYSLPTGSKYKQPLMLDYPCLVARVTQLETNFEISDLKNRMLRTNNSQWNEMAAETGLITDIQYEEVSVPVGAAGVITGFATAYKVVYTIEENDLTVGAGAGTVATRNTDPGVDPSVNTTVAVNWKQMRPRIDSLVKIGDVIKPAVAVNPTLTSVYLTPSGGFWQGPNASWFGDVIPPIDLYTVYDDTDFDSFLRI